MKKYRNCGSSSFNTGTSTCPFVPNYIKTIILTPASLVIKDEDIESKLGELSHANRPDRIYPITDIEEYSPSGGEAETSQQGYGASQITGYSELIETWLRQYDEGLWANMIKIKNEPMRALLIDKDNVLIGERYSDTEIRGYELSSVYPSGQRYKTSSDNASMNVNLVYKDVEKAWSESKTLMPDSTILDDAKGLIWVDLVKTDTGSTSFKLVSHYDKLDLTEAYGELLEKTEAWNGTTAITYDAATQTLTITGSNPSLKLPSELYALGIKGIEQWQG